MSVVRDSTTRRHFAIPSAASPAKVRLYKALGITIQRETVPVEADEITNNPMKPDPV